MKVMTGTAAAAVALMAIGGAGTALADPGHGRGQGGSHRDDRVGTDTSPGARVTPPCVKTHDVMVGYVFRGTVTATAPDSVTVNLSGANAHAKWVLARATPPVIISTQSASDLLLVPIPAGTRVTRNDVAGTPLVGDQVVVKYRAPHSGRVGKRCAPGATFAVTVAGTPPVATFSGTGVKLKRVSAWGN